MFELTYMVRWLRMPTTVVRDWGGACGAAAWPQRGRVPAHDHGHERAERQSVRDALNDSVPSQRKVSLSVVAEKGRLWAALWRTSLAVRHWLQLR